MILGIAMTTAYSHGSNYLSVEDINEQLNAMPTIM